MKEFDLLPDPEAEKPRKLASIGYGLPDKKRFEGLKDYYLAKNFINYNEYDLSGLKAADAERLAREIIKRRRYNLDGNSYKLPTYYRKRFFYEKDYSGSMRAIAVQRLVSTFVQRDYEQNLMAELQRLATEEFDGDMVQALDRYNMIHEAELQAREEAIKENNLKYLRKSKIA